MHRNSDRVAGPWRVIRYRNNLAASPAMSAVTPKAEANSERWRPRYGALRVDAVRATSSSGSSTRLSRAGVSQPDMTSLQPTIWPSSNSHQSEFGCDQRNAEQRGRHRALQQHEGIAEADGERAAQLAFGDRPPGMRPTTTGASENRTGAPKSPSAPSVITSRNAPMPTNLKTTTEMYRFRDNPETC